MYAVIRTDKKKKNENEMSYFTLHFISPVVHAGPVRSAILEVSNKLLLVTGGCWWAGAAVNNSPILRKTHSARLSASQQPCCPCRGMLPCYAMPCDAHQPRSQAAGQPAGQPHRRDLRGRLVGTKRDWPAMSGKMACLCFQSFTPRVPGHPCPGGVNG